MHLLEVIFIEVCFSGFIERCFSIGAQLDPKLKNVPNSFLLPQQNINCGISYVKPNLADTRIINGVNAVQNSWPWVVSIQYYDSYSKSFYSGCDGSILYENYILTAAHCVNTPDVTPKTIMIVVGVTDLSKATSLNNYQVDKIYFYSNYKGNSNDIALLKLKRPIKFSTNIRPICLPNSENDSSKVIGKTLILIGW